MGSSEFREQARVEERDRRQTDALERIADALETIAERLKTAG